MMTEDLTQTVERARAGGLQEFASLVREFQDVTFGCAYAYLGDYHLAEDASQEAWLRAYVELPRLRESAAFPGWLRQVTLGCCSRFVRGRRLPVAPLDLARDLESGELAADDSLVAEESARSVQQAVRELPPRQREAVLLYYMSSLSQKQAAAFLDVPETTVKKRLYDARQRLKERMMDMVREQAEQNAPSRNDGFSRKVLEGIRATTTEKAGWSSLISCLQPMLMAAGTEVSVARLAGVFGHAFSFYAKRQPGEVWQSANIDWWLLWESIDMVGCRFEEAQANGTKVEAGELQKMKEESWTAVTESIDRGVPAMAWTPMTVEQRDRGIQGWEWGLLVGYDEKERTYTVRNHGNATAYEVPYDGFGYCDPVQWYAVMWPAGERTVDAEEVARRSLEQAVAYAHGTRFESTKACYPVDALGLEAYELFRERIVEDMTAADARTQAGILRWAREAAASFCREMGPASGSEAILREAAEHYGREVEALGKLHTLCGEAALARGHREEAVALLVEATRAETAAVSAIEGTL